MREVTMEPQGSLWVIVLYMPVLDLWWSGARFLSRDKAKSYTYEEGIEELSRMEELMSIYGYHFVAPNKPEEV